MGGRPLLLLTLLASAALLALSGAQSPTDCDLGDPTGLNRCIRQLLVGARPKIAQHADPLRLPNFKEGDLSGKNVVVTGIARYNVKQLSVSLPRDQQISVSASIEWPSLKAELNVKVRKCKWILCATVNGRPEVTVGRSRGTLTTTLNVDVASNGRITVTARRTRVSLNLPDVSVKANVSGAIGLFNRLFGDPISRIATDLTNKWWRKNKSRIEAKARDALDRAVRERVSAYLSRVLTL